MFCSVLPGSRSAAGADAAVAATAVSAAMTANRAPRAVARPVGPLAASMAARTGTAGQAVALRAHATPAVTAALSGHRAASARDAHSNAITGTSVPPVAICSEMTGEATANAVFLTAAAPAPPRIRNPAKIPAIPAKLNHSRGLPAQPDSPAAFGNPKTAISGS